MRTFEVHPIVYEEIEAARNWYENKAPFLGNDFLNEVEISMEMIKKTPETWPPYIRINQVRRILIHRFPFGIFYQFNKNKIQVIAVAHLHRSPEYWKKRL